MKTISISLSLVFMLLSFVLHAQIENACKKTDIYALPDTVKHITKKDSLYFNSLPRLTLPESYRNKSLPAVLDNGTQPYFRPVFQQSGCACGQASGDAFTFTYEIDYLRDVPANLTQNQYPTHHTYNFLDYGGTVCGASFFDSWKITTANGIPDVATYGGMYLGWSAEWVSGYSKYYSGMHNRLGQVYTIWVGDVEGLQTLKNWINDHLDGSAVGGVASFYANNIASPGTLAAGTPEAGKHVITQWGNYANHAMCIVGWNDSVRYDYNGDGQYTNDLDITGDGIVDLRDWEIGALKFANSYDGGPAWADGGFCYMMFRTLGFPNNNGGIWNQSVFVLRPKVNYEPKLTLKATVKHDSRNKLKIYSGVALNTSATYPEFVLEFPLFNYQGGELYMQGGSSIEANKTLELGLDITPLLNYVPTGQQAKYFLLIDEDDPSGMGTGEIINFSVMDYTSGVNETACPSTNVPLNENNLTTLSVTTTVNYSEVSITTASLPPAIIYDPYSFQMQATGGNIPYTWYFDTDFSESSTTETFPSTSAEQLSLSHNDNGYAVHDLAFEFPFNGEKYTSVAAHADGFLMLGWQTYNVPYEFFDNVLFTYTKTIAPYMADLELFTGDGIWYEGNQDSAVFRWKAALNDASSTELNFAVTLHKNGDLDFYYGDNSQAGTTNWVSGISMGDQRNYQYTSVSGGTGIPLNTKLELEAAPYPEGLEISQSGLITGTPLQYVSADSLKFKVFDNENLVDRKTLPFHTSGIQIIEELVNSGGDELIEFSETTYLGFSVENVGSVAVNNVKMTIWDYDQYTTMTDSIETLGTLAPGITVPFADIFTFTVASDVPDGHTFDLHVEIMSAVDTVNTVVQLTIYAPVVMADYYTVDDGVNYRLDPGETADLTITFVNAGGSTVMNPDFVLTSLNPLLTLNTNTGSAAVMDPDSSASAVFNVTVSAATPIETIIPVKIDITGDNGYVGVDTLNLDIGFVVEDFETGNFLKYPWYFSGNAGWVITNVDPYERIFCAKSGTITHSQTSSLIIELNVIQDGELSFYKKVSCEDDPYSNVWDFLAFYINGQQMNRWDGQIDWSKETYYITAGLNTFEWRYSKDNTVSSGYDCAWVDYIKFPPVGNISPFLTVTPDSLYEVLPPNSTKVDTLYLTNSGGFSTSYNITLYGSGTTVKSEKSIDGSYMICQGSDFTPGTSTSMDFYVYNASTDSEWLKDIFLQFPSGVNVTGATGFVGGSGGTMLYDGTTGDGVNINWHGEDGSGWGLIHGSESATASVDLIIDPGFTGDMNLFYQLDGDIYGATPHTVTGDITLTNLGLPVTWLTIDSLNGIVDTGMTKAVPVTFNSTGLAPGEYHCDIHIEDGLHNLSIIPATLVVTNLEITTPAISKYMLSNETDTDTIHIVNYDTATSYYTNNEEGAGVSWLSLTPAVDMVNAGDSNIIVLNYNTAGLATGMYWVNIYAEDVINNVYAAPGLIPVLLYVNITVISEGLDSGEGISIWPNPTDGKVYLGNAEGATVKLYDLFGREVITIENYRDNINLEGIANGSYIIRIDNKRSLVTGKLILMR